MKRGQFITFEGGEGCGKSTQARRLQRWLEAKGRRVVLTREPGGAPLSEAIRALVLERWDAGMTPVTETLLMFAARAAHLAALVEPTLANDVDVICDRFIDSSFAYQGAGKGVDLRHLQALEAFVMPTLKPDLTLLLDLPVEEGLKRARSRGDANRFEDEALIFQQRVRDAFLERARADRGRCRTIDASGDESAVFERIVRALEGGK